MYNCPGCNVDYSDGVNCSKCQKYYCFSCANMTEVNYRKLGPARQANLLCGSCKNLTLGTSSPKPGPHTPGHSPTTLDQVLAELRQGISSINGRLDSQLPTLIHEVKEMKENLSGIEDTISDIKKDVKRHDVSILDFSERLHQLEVQPQGVASDEQVNSKLSQLSAELAAKDQMLRLNNIELKGVPEKHNENLFNLACKIGEVIGQPTAKSDINFITRARSSTSTKTIIVGFVNRYTKENFVASARAFKKLTAEDIGFAGDASRLFVNDHLTPENKRLLTRAKQLAREKGHKHVWVQNCKILTREGDKSPIIPILKEGDLAKIQ